MYAMQAIETKYHGATNTRGARVSARCAAGRVSVSWDHALDPADNHAAAVVALATKLGWQGRRWHLGGKPDGGFVAVCVDRDNMITAGAWTGEDRALAYG